MLTCLVLSVLLPPAQEVRSQAADLAWPEITSENKPWTRWWWPGSAVDRDNLRHNLEMLAEAGIGGVEVTSIYGVQGQEDRFIPYLSPAWVEMLRYAAGEARRLGMGLDMPPGSGWRTGGPFVEREDANASLHIEVDTVRGGALWQRDVSGHRLEAVVAFDAQRRLLDLTDQAAGGSLRWQAPEGTWTVYVVETRWSGEEVKRPAPGGEGLTIDPFSHRSVERFFASYEDRIDRIPKGTIRAFFHDSFEYTGSGSAELLDAFRQRRGYDLTRHVPALTGQGDAEEVARVKADYRETLSEMLRENFVLPLASWAHRQGSLSRNQAHGSPGNLLDLYAAADIPETEIFGPLGGADNDPLISKFASSAAHVAGKPLCSAETATWLGEHFNVSLDLLKQAVDQLFVSGVNHIIYHGTAYSPREAAWPGWLFYASTQLNPRNAIWRDLPALNQYAARCQSILQLGHPDNEVLLYWPVHDNWHDPTGLRMDFAVHRPNWFYGKPVSEVARRLWERGYGFDYISDFQLAGTSVAGDGRIRTGGAVYQAIMVPRTDHMPLETLATLIERAEAGATVLFQSRLPADVPGLGRLAARRGQLEALKDTLSFENAGQAGVQQAAAGRGRLLVGDDLDLLLQAARVAREPMVDHQGIQFIRRRHAQGRHYFIRHAGGAALDGWVALSVPAASAALMDPVSGRTGLADLRTNLQGQQEVYLQLEPGAALVLRTFDDDVTGALWTYRVPAGPPVEITGTWEVAFIEGGSEQPAAFQTDTLASWTVLGDEKAGRFAGTARYTIRFDAPAAAGNYLLDLGEVAESARVRLNGSTLGTLFARPFRLETGRLQPHGNVLEVEVTNLSANRIRDLDRRQVPWKIFHDINFVNIDYRPFDASPWPLRPSGLLGPVQLQPLRF